MLLSDVQWSEQLEFSTSPLFSFSPSFPPPPLCDSFGDCWTVFVSHLSTRWYIYFVFSLVSNYSLFLLLPPNATMNERTVLLSILCSCKTNLYIWVVSIKQYRPKKLCIWKNLQTNSLISFNVESWCMRNEENSDTMDKNLLLIIGLFHSWIF